MEQAEFIEKRLFHRVPVNIGVQYLDLTSQKQAQGKICDLSANGLGLITEENLSTQTPLEIWLKLPGKTDPLHTKGKVVWSKMLDNQHYRIGVHLDKLELICFAPLLRYHRQSST